MVKNIPFNDFNEYLVNKYNLAPYFRRSDPMRRGHYKLIIPKIKEQSENAMFCDIGCGDITLAYILDECGYQNYVGLDYNTKIINTDVIRKKIAGINLYEKHHNNFNTGLYSPDKILFTYKKVIEEARNLLINNENVIIDATFQQNEYRRMVNELSEELNIIPLFIQCTAPDNVVKVWLEDRMKTETVSDGRWEIYKSQKKFFEPFSLRSLKSASISTISPTVVPVACASIRPTVVGEIFALP